MTGRRPGDAGMTLVELTVAMAITTVLLAGISTVMIGTFRAISLTNVKTADSADLRIGLEAVSRTLRVATLPAGEDAAFTTATSGQLAFYSLLNRTGGDSVTQPLPTLVSYAWDSTTKCVNQSTTPGRALVPVAVTDPSFAWDTGTVTTCLLRTGIAPVFAYYDDTTTTTAMTAPVTDTDLQTITSVSVTLTAKDPRQSRDQGVPATVRISLPNVIAALGS